MSDNIATILMCVLGGGGEYSHNYSTMTLKCADMMHNYGFQLNN